jgi:hypothetical protein
MADVTTPRYPDITIQLTGQDGNATAIIGRVSRVLRREKVPPEEIEQFVNEAISSPSYHDLLTVVQTWVDVW